MLTRAAQVLSASLPGITSPVVDVQFLSTSHSQPSSPAHNPASPPSSLPLPPPSPWLMALHDATFMMHHGQVPQGPHGQAPQGQGGTAVEALRNWLRVYDIQGQREVGCQVDCMEQYEVREQLSASSM